MADNNLCGPSNGAKNLVNHVNQDRSLQQDRMVNGAAPMGPMASQSTFRSQPARVNGNDQDFAGFQQNGHMGPVLGSAPAFGAQASLNYLDALAGQSNEFGPDRLGGGPGPDLRTAMPVPAGFPAMSRLPAMGPAPAMVAPPPGFGAQHRPLHHQHPQGAAWAGPTPSAMNRGIPLAAHAPSGPATANRDWVNQFASMQIGANGSQATAPGFVGHRQPALAVHGNHFQHSMAQFGPGQPGGFANHPFTHGPTQIVAPIIYGNQGTTQIVAPIVSTGHGNQRARQEFNPPQQDVESAISADAFNQAFGEYDEALFNDELANWSRAREDRARADAEFEEAQDAWMAVHRPGRSADLERLLAEDEALAAAAMEEAMEEEEAKEKEEQSSTAQVGGEAAVIRHREDEDLARAAISILASVSENNSEKFKNSNFFELMRRIGNGEVVVDGSHLVDAVTGETVASKEPSAAAEEEGAAGSA